MSMEKEMWEERIIEFLDGKGTAEERSAFELELASNKEFATLYEQLREVIQAIDNAAPVEPSSQLKSKFERALQKEIQNQKQGRQVFFSPAVYRIAAGVVFVMMTLGIGYWINLNNERDRRLAELEQQVKENRQIMLAKLDDQQSASQRMIGVSVAYELKTADDEIVNVLEKTMNEDANTNVRLAALEAFGKFSNEEIVRQVLIKSLSTQKDPVVQIALIQLLVKLKENGVVNQLEKLTKDGSVMKAVKDEAYTGILKLS